MAGGAFTSRERDAFSDSLVTAFGVAFGAAFGVAFGVAFGAADGDALVATAAFVSFSGFDFDFTPELSY